MRLSYATTQRPPIIRSHNMTILSLQFRFILKIFLQVRDKAYYYINYASGTTQVQITNIQDREKGKES